jgi:two-component system, OmpR family, sensor histidine kinase CpxA
MKVSIPLSLKVTLWFLLNLLLLAATAITFLAAQGGVGWDSLVTGAQGDHLHALANIITGEVAAASRENRDAVLARFGAAYGAEFLLVRNHGPVLAGRGVDIPDGVRQRIDEGPVNQGPRGGPPGFGPSNLGPRDEDLGPADRNPGQPPLSSSRRTPPRLGRFLFHGGEPASWWIGLRVPFSDDDRPIPATLIVHASSLGRVIRLLNLQTWLLGGLAVLTLSIVFWLPLVRSITGHLRALTTATEKIAEGKFETRVPTNRRDELGRLGESVNTMAARLDTLVNGQKRFLGDIAHELGSPLGRLQVATEILESRADPKLRDQVADVREEVQHMAELVNELLAFTKAGMRPRDAELTVVSVDDVFAKVIAREDLHARVKAAPDTALRVLADESLLTRAISNLVRNAIRYTGEGVAIELGAQAIDDRVVITVDDEGPGVPAASLTRLGEPFYRPELARTRETGGVGLGLAIVRSAVLACGGEVHFSNRHPRGFRAELRLTAG